MSGPGVEGCRVFDVQRFSVHDGPGIRTTVFLEGCPLRCAWCQNPEAFAGAGAGSRAAPLSPEAVLAEVLKDRAYYATSGGGLTVSGGEPLLRPTALRALLEQARRHGVHTCVQTCGAVPEAHFAAVLGLVDLFQFDLKHQNPARHRALTGADPERIHSNAEFLLRHGAAVQFRLPVVPGVNDDLENLEQTAAFLRRHGVATLRLVPYQRLCLGKYRELGLEPALPNVEPPTAAGLARVTAHFAQRGVEVEVDA